jgi:hypothetical protein
MDRCSWLAEHVRACPRCTCTRTCRRKKEKRTARRSSIQITWHEAEKKNRISVDFPNVAHRKLIGRDERGADGTCLMCRRIEPLFSFFRTLISSSFQRYSLRFIKISTITKIGGGCRISYSTPRVLNSANHQISVDKYIIFVKWLAGSHLDL